MRDWERRLRGKPGNAHLIDEDVPAALDHAVRTRRVVLRFHFSVDGALDLVEPLLRLLEARK